MALASHVMNKWLSPSLELDIYDAFFQVIFAKECICRDWDYVHHDSLAQVGSN